MSILNSSSVSPHDFCQVFELSNYLTINKFEVVNLAETFLNSSILTNDSSLDLPGYNFVRKNHLSNTQIEGTVSTLRTHLR